MLTYYYFNAFISCILVALIDTISASGHVGRPEYFMVNNPTDDSLEGNDYLLNYGSKEQVNSYMNSQSGNSMIEMTTTRSPETLPIPQFRNTRPEAHPMPKFRKGEPIPRLKFRTTGSKRGSRPKFRKPQPHKKPRFRNPQPVQRPNLRNPHPDERPTFRNPKQKEMPTRFRNAGTNKAGAISSCKTRRDCPEDADPCPSRSKCIMICQNNQCKRGVVPVGCRSKSDCNKEDVCASGNCVKANQEKQKPRFKSGKAKSAAKNPFFSSDVSTNQLEGSGVVDKASPEMESESADQILGSIEQYIL